MPAKKRSATTAARPVQLNLRVSPETQEALDAYVEELNSKRTWPKLTRTEVLRFAVERLLRERPEIP